MGGFPIINRFSETSLSKINTVIDIKSHIWIKLKEPEIEKYLKISKNARSMFPKRLFRGERFACSL